MFKGSEEELPCCPWRLGEVLPLAKGFCRAQEKLSGFALYYQLTSVKQSIFMCCGMRLLEVSHRPVTIHAPSNAGPFRGTSQRVPEMSHGASPALGSPGGRWSLVVLPLAHRLVLLSEKPLLGAVQEFMAGFGASHLGGLLTSGE